MAIRLKSKAEIELMRAAGRVVRQVLEHCRQIAKPGITTGEIDAEAYEVFTRAGAKGLFKGYPSYRSDVPAFPGNVCVSVNEELVHGIGGSRVLKDGDIVSIDCGVQLGGWCGDSAVTLMIGEVSEEARRLCQVTQEVLQIAIDNIQPRRRWSTVARLMQKHAEAHGMGVVKEYVGHGIGQKMHEDPQVPNYVENHPRWTDIELNVGMVLAIEPMLNLGTPKTRVLSDGWTVVTADGKPAAHFEHTVAVTASGADVLTDGR